MAGNGFLFIQAVRFVDIPIMVAYLSWWPCFSSSSISSLICSTLWWTPGFG